MSDLNLQLVREFFELNLFRVLTNWQQESWRTRGAEPGSQLFVENCGPATPGSSEFILLPSQVGCIERAVVEVRAWHGDRFYASTIESNPVLSQFVEEDSLALAREVFDGRDFQTILVVSELPATAEHRQRSASLLQNAGIGFVLEFPAILQDMLERVSVNGNYAASSSLQLMRLLKRYRLIRNQQLELNLRGW